MKLEMSIYSKNARFFFSKIAEWVIEMFLNHANLSQFNFDWINHVFS